MDLDSLIHKVIQEYPHSILFSYSFESIHIVHHYNQFVLHMLFCQVYKFFLKFFLNLGILLWQISTNNESKEKQVKKFREFDEKKKYNFDHSRWVPKTYLVDLTKDTDEEEELYRVKMLIL